MQALPQIVCTDGTRLSVQVGFGLYCTPRSNEGPWTEAEVGFPTARPSWWDKYAEQPGTLNTVAVYVPIELVRDFIAEHGGIANVSELQAALPAYHSIAALPSGQERN